MESPESQLAPIDEFIHPMDMDGEPIIEVECGENRGIMFLSRLCQGSKGPCIMYNNSFLTPNEFQYISGRETAKDWKRSIRHKGKSMKLLITRGLLNVHRPACECDGCRISSPVNRGRLNDKRILNVLSEMKRRGGPARVPFDRQVSGARTGPPDLESPPPSETELYPGKTVRRESRLTSIIEQLRTTREKEVLGNTPLHGYPGYHLNAPEDETMDGESDEDRHVNSKSVPLHFGNDENAEPQCQEPRPNSVPMSFRVCSSGSQEQTKYEGPSNNNLGESPANGMCASSGNPFPVKLSDIHVAGQTSRQHENYFYEKSAQEMKSAYVGSHKAPAISHGSVGGSSHYKWLESGFMNYNNNVFARRHHPFYRKPTRQVPTPRNPVRHALSDETRSPSLVRQPLNEPLDLSKKVGIKFGHYMRRGDHCNSTCSTDDCAPNPVISARLKSWSVEDVAKFLSSFSGFSDCVHSFREQHIDGNSLGLLSVNHMIDNLGMKLGPALNLRSFVSKATGRCETCMHCIHCHGAAAKDEKRENL